MTGVVIAIVVAVIVVLLVIWLVSSYNGFVEKKNVVEEGWSTIDVYLKKRYDLIPNLVETVKGYAKHESETLEKVIAARNATTMMTGNGADRMAAENALTGTLRSLFAVSEAYPELKANTNFTDLQSQLKAIEGEIASSRKYYNGTVKVYNTAIQKFPSNIAAGIFRFTEFEYFNAPEEERQNVKVKF